MKRLVSIVFIISLIVGGCATKSNKASDTEKLEAKANELAHKFLITDGHIDLPYRLREHMEDISVRTENGNFDYVRAKEGGLDAPFMSIYIPASFQQTGGAKELADTLIDMVENLAMNHPDKFALAHTPDEAIANFKKGLVSLPMGMENGAPIGTDIANVKYFQERGIRYITLTHGKDNEICDSSYDTTRTWNGLSPFGVEVVKEMNHVGIMIDVAHISDSTFYQVMRISQTPVIASHSSCRHFTPGFERNMSDEMIKILADKGGVIQINFGSTFLDQSSIDKNKEIDKHVGDWIEEHHLERRDSVAREYANKYREENFKFSTVTKVADHIDHVVSIAGIDHVGLGSDFDGVGNSLPVGLKDASDYPNLILELLKRGYSEEDIEKICSKNVFRVWRAVEKAAH